jgi:AbrB family looped-hinge helix DNA binding protein
MKTTMDSAGRLVIPSAVRREAGLQPGMPLEIAWIDGRIQIEPAPTPVRLVEKGHLTVAIPLEPIQTLDAETVEKTLNDLRSERG